MGAQLRRRRVAVHGGALPRVFGSLLLESASFVFTDIGVDHGGGPVFDPVVKFVNALPRQAQAGRGADLHDLRDVRAADHPEPLDGHDVPARPAWRCATSSPATGTTGRTGVTGCATA